MSGGSWNYFYYKLDEAAKEMPDLEVRDLMEDLAALCHDAEWYDSGDYSRETYEDSLAKFKKKWFKDSREERLKYYIDKKLNEVKNELYGVIGEKCD